MKPLFNWNPSNLKSPKQIGMTEFLPLLELTKRLSLYCPLSCERLRFLFAKILDEIDEHGIKIYHLPDAESDEDEDFKEQTRILKVSQSFLWLPFCLFAMNCIRARESSLALAIE